MPTLLVLGATSGIAKATAYQFAKAGWDLQLAGRDIKSVSSVADELSKLTECNTSCFKFDAMKIETHIDFVNHLPKLPDAVLISVGLLGNQEEAKHNPNGALTILQVNFVGIIPIISIIADKFEERGYGTIIGISSVAGDRGRSSNYIYGSAKAGFTAYLSGLRQRLFKCGVRVMTIKPGYVATKMIAHKKTSRILTAQPDEVGYAIYKAYTNKKDIVYVRWFWRYILFFAKIIPECIFKRIPM